MQEGEPVCRQERHRRRRDQSVGKVAPETAANPSNMRRGELVVEGVAGQS